MTAAATLEHPLRFSVHSRLRAFHLARMMPDGTGKVLLDNGCGLGFLTATLGGGYDLALGIDMDLGSLRSNRARGLGVMAMSGAARLPLADASVDVILCSEVLEHLPDGVDAEAMAEMGRVLKPGGRLYITVPALEGVRSRTALRNLGHDDPNGGEYHYRIGYGQDALRALVAAVPGLTALRHRYSMALLSELFMDLLKLVYFRKGKLHEHSDLMSANASPLFRVYRRIFPLLFAAFVAEDFVLCPWLRGHIHILEIRKD